jgi:lipopolysaccharide export system protein LptA
MLPLASADAQSALKDHDTYQPIDISAERLEMQQKQGRAIFTGAVQVTQGKMVLRSETITVFYTTPEGDSDPTISRLNAQGNFSLKSPSETLSGDWGIYDVDQQLVTVGGTVVLNQGGTELTGTRLEFDLESGLAKLDGQSTDGSQGRVKGNFSVPKKPPEDERRN